MFVKVSPGRLPACVGSRGIDTATWSLSPTRPTTLRAPARPGEASGIGIVTVSSPGLGAIVVELLAGVRSTVRLSAAAPGRTVYRLTFVAITQACAIGSVGQRPMPLTVPLSMVPVRPLV